MVTAYDNEELGPEGEGEVGWGSTEYIVLHPKPPLPPEFGYCIARSEPFRDFAIQSMTGASGRQRVPAESLAHFRLGVKDASASSPKLFSNP
jgi:type I restriction enzyme S subunit